MKKILAVALLGLLAGCGATGRTKIVSRNYVGDAGGMPSIKSVLVIYNVFDTGFDGKTYQGFKSSMKRRLEQCGVHTASLEYNPMSLDTEQNIRKLIAKNDVDIVFKMNKNGGSLTTGVGGVQGVRYYKLEAIDTHVNKMFWEATVSFNSLTHNSFSDDDATGNRFGADIVARLAQDRVIANCPAEAITYSEN